jgi:hypothetical protein
MSPQERRSLLDIVDVTIEVTRYFNSGIVVHLTGSVPLEGDFDLLEAVVARRRPRASNRVGRQGLEPAHAQLSIPFEAEEQVAA